MLRLGVNRRVDSGCEFSGSRSMVDQRRANKKKEKKKHKTEQNLSPETSFGSPCQGVSLGCLSSEVCLGVVTVFYLLV